MRRALTMLLLAVAVAAAQAPYRLAEWVLDEGGTKATSSIGGNYLARGSFHQTTIGLATAPAGNLVGWIGYWHPRPNNITHDVALTRVLRPPYSMQPDTVTPVVVTANFGRVAEVFDVYIRIRKVGRTDTLYRGFRAGIGLSAGDSTTVSFTPVDLDTGTYEVIAWTHLDGDENPANDRVVSTTIVNAFDHDVGVVVINSPPLRVQQYDILPQAYVHNYGVNVENFWTHFRIIDSLGVGIYHDSVQVIGLAPGANYACIFSEVTLYDGWFDANCITELASDLNPANDSAAIHFLVGVFGWFTTTDIPPGPSNKQVNDGGCLASVPPNWIYGLKGNRSTEFWRFNVESQSWQARESIPRPLWRWRSRPVKKGGALCYDGADHLYAIKGYNTVEFYAYSVGGDTWTELDSVPYGPRQRRIRYGSGLAWQPKGDSSFAWLLKGSNTYDFIGYWAEGDTWLFHTEAPHGPRNKRWKAGSCVCADDQGRVFALKSDVNEFYSYDVATDEWSERAPMPFYLGSYKRKVKDGAALAFAGGDTIYAFKGGNTWQFFRYDISQDTWYEDIPIGLGNSLKRVKRGGSLAWSPTQRRVYAFKGNRTWEFWYFIPPPFRLADEPRPVQSGIAGLLGPDRTSVRVIPTVASGPTATIELELPVAATVDVYLLDISGRVLLRQSGLPVGPGRHRLPLGLESIPRGVYLLLADVSGPDGGRFTRKLVVQR